MSDTNNPRKEIVIKMSHPMIHTFQLSGEYYPEQDSTRYFLQTHTRVERGSGAAGGEQNVLLRPDDEAHEWMKRLARQIKAEADRYYLDEHVVWHGSIREWQIGESSEAHWDCYDENEFGEKIIMEAPQQNLLCDVSAILYVDSSNDGRLVFDDIGYEHSPKAGEIILFPTTTRHRVTEVTEPRMTVCMFLSRARTLALAEKRQRAGWSQEMYDPSPAIELTF